MSQNFFSQFGTTNQPDHQNFSSQLSNTAVLHMDKIQTLSQDGNHFNQLNLLSSQFSANDKIKQPTMSQSSRQSSKRNTKHPQNDLQTLLNFPIQQSSSQIYNDLPEKMAMGRNRSVMDFDHFQEMMNHQEELEKNIKDEINSSVMKQLADLAIELQKTMPQIPDEVLFELITEKNPAVNYLCEEIVKADEEFQGILQKAEVQLTKLTEEWNLLREEVERLKEHERKKRESSIKDHASDTVQPPVNSEYLEPLECIIRLSEDLMRESRADRIMMFLKLRFKDQLDCSDEKTVREIKDLYHSYQEKLAATRLIDIHEETRCIHSFFKDLQKKNLTFTQPSVQIGQIELGQKKGAAMNQTVIKQEKTNEGKTALKYEMKKPSIQEETKSDSSCQSDNSSEDDFHEKKSNRSENENVPKFTLGDLKRFLQNAKGDNASDELEFDLNKFCATKVNKKTVSGGGNGGVKNGDGSNDISSLYQIKDAVVTSMKGTISLNGKKRKLF